MKTLGFVGLSVIALSCFCLPTPARSQPHSSNATQVVAPTGPVPPDFFGMHIHKASKPKNYDAFVLTPWPQIPFKTWRLWDVQTTWRQLEPQKGVWHFELLDQYVALAEQKHVSVLMTLGQTPTWASARPTEKTYFPGTAAEPASLKDWDDYIRTIATRYKGRIHAYEIWNEPNLPMFYSGSIDTLAEMNRRATAILKQIDPTITVVTPGITRDPQYLDRFLKAGGAKGADVIGFHFYVHGQPEEALSTMARVKQVLADNNLSSLPVWNTEAGWGDWKDGVNTFTPQLAAAFVARANILAWVGGISRFYWYSWDNHEWVKLYMTERDNTTETPAAQAYRTVQNWMIGSRFQLCRQSPENVWTCALTRGGHPAWIAWSPSGDTTYNLNPSWPVTKVMSLTGQSDPLAGKTITVGPSPILLY